LCGSQKKQQLFLYTVLTDGFYNRDGDVFTARYGLDIYVHFRLIFFFKGLIRVQLTFHQRYSE